MKIQNLIAIDILLTHKKADEGLKTLKSSFSDFSKQLSLNAANANPQLFETSERFRKLGNTISTTGDTLTKFISVPVIGVLGKAVKAAADYESAFAGVEKTVDATREELDTLSLAIKRMSTELPATTTEIAGVGEAAGQLGIHVNDIEEFTEVMIGLGVATNITADDAAESFARLFNIMGNTSDEYERAGSVLVELGNNYATNEKQIMDMTMRLAAAGKQAGMTTSDIMGMSTGLSAMGIKAEAGGGSMSKFISNMNVAVSMGTGKLRELEEQTGMTWRQMQMMAENSPRGFRTLADSIGLPTSELKRFVYAGKDAQQMADVAGVSVDKFAEIFEDNAAVAVGMFIEGLADAQDGIESMTLTGEDAITILQEMGISEIRLRDGLLRSANAGDLLTGAIKDANAEWETNEALTREASIRYETLDSQWQMFKNTLQLIAINLGEQFLPMLKDLIKWMKGFAENIANMDPKKFQAIAKGLLAMGAAGPALKIAGTALKGFGAVGKIMSVSSMELKGILGLSNKLSTAYRDGGWSGQGAKYMEQFGHSLNKAGQVIRGNGQYAFQSLDKELKNVGKSMKDVSKSVGSDGLVKSFNQLINSPVLKAGLWAAAAGYVVTLFTEFEFLQDAAKVLWETLKVLTEPLVNFTKAIGNGISDITDGAIGILDIGAAAGGLLLTLNPATAAVGAFIAGVAGVKAVFGFIRRIGKEAEDTVPQFQLSSETLGKMNEQLGMVENSYTRFIDETSPELQEAYEDIHNKLMESKLAPDKEDLQVSVEDFQEYTELITTKSRESRELLRKELVEGLKERGELETDYGVERLEAFDGFSISMENEQDLLIKKILELQRKKLEDAEGLDEEEAIQLETHLARLEEITLVKQQETFDKEFEQYRLNLEMKRRMGIELTEDELETLNLIMGEKLEERQQEVASWYHAELEDLDAQLKSKRLTEEEHTEKVDELYRRMFADYIKAGKENAADYIEILTGKNMKELEEMMKTQKDLDAINEAIYREELKSADKRDQAKIDALNKLRKHTEDELAEINLTKEEWASFSQHLKDTLPPELADTISKMEDEMDLDFMFEIMDKAGIKLKDQGAEIGENLSDGVTDGLDKSKAKVDREIYRMTKGMEEKAKETLSIKSPSRVFLTIGQYVGDGLIQGINNRSSAVTTAARNMANVAYNAAKNALQIKSPSRAFRGLGQFLPEGMALGIEDEAKLAIGAARAMSEDITRAAALDTSYTMTGVKDLKSYTEITADSNFVQTLKTAIIEAFATSGPITAYIGKEEAKENFDLNLLKSLAGKYNK